MKSIGLYRSAVVLSAIAVAVAGCRVSKTETNPNRVNFEIDSLYKMIHLPIKINDTVTARMAFDTGCPWGIFDIDSTFCASNGLHLWKQKPTYTLPAGGSAWVSEFPGSFSYCYESDFTVRIGKRDIDYHSLSVWNRRDYFGHSNYSGMFAIPETDTTHVWELNFEHNFMEIHAADTFKMPDDCLIAPMSLDHPQMRVTIPMKITTSDGDSLIVEREFLVDSGMGWDVAFMPPAEELSFFDGKEFVPFGFADGGYVSRYITDAEIFDGFHIDSLHVYTLKKPIRVRTGYWIGLNFLKRFNVFFGMKSNQR